MRLNQTSDNNYQLNEILQNYQIHYTLNNNDTLKTYKNNINKLMIKLQPALDKSLITDNELKSNFSMYI